MLANNNKTTKGNKTMTMTAEQKREQHRNYKRRQRANPEHRKKEREINKNLMRKYRTCPEYRERTRKINKENHKKRMQYPEYRNKHNQLGRVRGYGLSLDDLASIYKAQGGKCAICQSPKTLKGNGCLHIDHCHETNQVRGLLCHKCNN